MLQHSLRILVFLYYLFYALQNIPRKNLNGTTFVINCIFDVVNLHPF